MADVPDALTLARNRDAVGLREIRFRRTGMALLVLLGVAGLANVFGQRPDTISAAGPAASLDLYAPSHVRGGLYYEARFHIRAIRDLKDAILVLDPGWAEGTTINTVEPSPVGEASRDGRLSFDLGHVPAGQSYLLFLQLQVNPTNVGHRPQDARLYDGDTLLVELDRSITIYP
jgi:hypothetical protein